MHACRFGLTRRNGFRTGQQECLKDLTFAIFEPFDLNLNGQSDGIGLSQEDRPASEQLAAAPMSKAGAA
jgi:hypothetical protein